MHNRPPKHLGIILSCLAFLCITYVGMRSTILSSFASLEREELVEDVGRCRNLISSELQQLATTAGDYAGWDDTYNFVQTGNPEFVKANINPAVILKLRLNLVVITDINGKIIHASLSDYRSGKTRPLPGSLQGELIPGRGLLSHSSVESSISGLLPFPDGILLVASRPVLTSDFKGPAKGTLIIGRYLDEPEIRRLADIVRLKMAFIPPPSSPTGTSQRLSSGEPVNIGLSGPDTIVGSTVLNDIHGSPAGAVQVTRPRLIYQEGKRAANEYFTLTALIATGLTLLLIHYMTKRNHFEESLRVSEERWKFALEGARDGVWDWDIPTGKVYFSDRLKWMMGNMHGDMEPDFDEWRRHIHPDDADRVRTDLSSYLDGTISEYVNEHRLLCTDGSWKWILDRGMVIKRDTYGRPLRMIGTHTDITARKEMEAELHVLNDALERRVKERTAELERLNRELEGFCYSISHELRAPIARLEAFSRVIAECAVDGTPEQLVHLAEQIGVSSHRLRSVVDALLQMTRITRADLAEEPVNLSILSRQIMAELLENAGERSVTVSVAPDIVARGDRHMLGVCLQNLLGNAVKFTAKVTGATVEFGQIVQEGTNVYFVRDNGAGFDMTYADQLFEPFRRLHGDNEFDGNGIGLATVQRIIERHGGEIWSEAAPGKGATFYFTLGKEVLSDVNGADRS